MCLDFDILTYLVVHWEANLVTLVSCRGMFHGEMLRDLIKHEHDWKLFSVAKNSQYCSPKETLSLNISDNGTSMCSGNLLEFESAIHLWNVVEMSWCVWNLISVVHRLTYSFCKQRMWKCTLHFLRKPHILT